MNPYEILGVEPTADKSEIEKTYRSKARKTHPDHGGDKDEFKQLALAYSILKDENKRKHFDETGSTESENTEDSVFRQLIIQAFIRSDNPIEVALKKVQSDIENIEKARETELAQAKTLEKRLAKFKKSNHPDSEDKELIIESIEASIIKHQQDAKGFDTPLNMLTRFKKRLSSFKSPQEASIFMQSRGGNMTTEEKNEVMFQMMDTMRRAYYST